MDIYHILDIYRIYIINIRYFDIYNKYRIFSNPDQEVNSLFGFLTDFLIKSDDQIKEACTKFCEHYSEDIEHEFINEMVQFKYFVLQLEDAGKDNIVAAEESYKLILNNMVQSIFPLQIYRSLMITNASGERNFSKLKLLKNSLRATMSQHRLNSLSIMAIENDVLEKVHIEEVVKDFISKKVRKVHI